MDEETTDYFITTTTRDGNVDIRGGLVFHHGGFFKAAARERGAPAVRVEGLTLVGSTPRWWQISKWWKLIQKIRSYAPSK